MTKKVLLILNVLICMILFFGCNGKTQEKKSVKNIYKAELENKTWITDKILGLDSNVEQYNLTKFIQRKFAGNLTEFRDEMIFNSQYVSFCGNDYFTEVSGKYRFLDNDKISISIDSVTYSGERQLPTEHRKSEDIIFLISKKGERIVLTKQK